jgi:hypothetical protein
MSVKYVEYLNSLSWLGFAEALVVCSDQMRHKLTSRLTAAAQSVLGDIVEASENQQDAR